MWAQVNGGYVKIKVEEEQEKEDNVITGRALKHCSD